MLPDYLKEEVIAACALLDNPEYGGSEEDIILSMIAERRAMVSEMMASRRDIACLSLWLAEIELLRGELE